MLKSKGYCLFNLRIWSVVSSNWVTNGFWWLLILILYLLLNLDISSLTVGILRSRCIVSLVTYQSASIKNLKLYRRMALFSNPLIVEGVVSLASSQIVWTKWVKN